MHYKFYNDKLIFRILFKKDMSENLLQFDGLKNEKTRDDKTRHENWFCLERNYQCLVKLVLSLFVLCVFVFAYIITELLAKKMWESLKFCSLT